MRFLSLVVLVEEVPLHSIFHIAMSAEEEEDGVLDLRNCVSSLFDPQVDGLEHSIDFFTHRTVIKSVYVLFARNVLMKQEFAHLLAFCFNLGNVAHRLDFMSR